METIIMNFTASLHWGQCGKVLLDHVQSLWIFRIEDQASGTLVMTYHSENIQSKISKGQRHMGWIPGESVPIFQKFISGESHGMGLISASMHCRTCEAWSTRDITADSLPRAVYLGIVLKHLLVYPILILQTAGGNYLLRMSCADCNLGAVNCSYQVGSCGVPFLESLFSHASRGQTCQQAFLVTGVTGLLR